MRSHFIVKIFIISTLLSIKSIIFGQAYEIKVHIKGAENQEAKLAYYLGENKYVEQIKKFDKNGKLVFKDYKILPTGIYLIIIGNKSFFELLITKDQKFNMTSDTSNLIGHMKISGSDENSHFFKYQTDVIKLKKRHDKISEIIKQLNDNNDSLSVLKEEKTSIENSLNMLWQDIVKNEADLYLAKILNAFNNRNLNKFDFADPDLLRTPVYNNMLRLFIKKNINTKASFIIFETGNLLNSLKETEANYQYVANYLLNFYNTFYKTGMNEVFVWLADNYFLPDKANWFNEKQLKEIQRRRNQLAKSLPGNMAPDLTLPNNTSEYISLHQLDSKYVILYFWSNNCRHCTTATTILKKAYPKLQEKNIEIFAVNIDKDTLQWQKKIENLELEWINCQDINEVSAYREKYYVYGSPLLYLINSKKVILSKSDGEKEIEKLINKLVGK
ncbi:MAG: redoxin domain-containing protein [Bacteroidota bacterium]